MLINSKENKIAPISIFFLLYISRIVITMTNIHSVTMGKMKTDILVSVLLSMGLTLILSMPAILCYQKHKSPFDIKWLGFIYSLYFIFLAALNISRFAYFASTTLNPDTQAWIFIIIVTACAGYGALLGIEGIARFTSFAFVLLLAAILSVLIFNVKNYDELNLYPAFTNDVDTVIKNTLLMTSSSGEMVIFLCLSKHINGNGVKPYVRSVTMSYLTIFVLFLFVIAVMGDAAALQSFPLYTFFQLAKVSLFQRLDVLHISFWILGIFVKSVLLIYCASISFKPMKNKTKCVVGSVLTFGSAVLITMLINSGKMKPVFYAIPFVIFCVIVPLITLIFKKRNYGDELVERF